MISPLEPFQVYFFNSFDTFHLNSTTFSLFLVIVLFSYLQPVFRKVFLIPTRLQYLIESAYTFILIIVKEQTRGSAANFFPLLFLLFVIIVFSNCIGLFPFAFTVTSQLAVTFAISLSFNLGFLFLGVFLHGFQFFKLFVPSGVPTVLLPLIVIIEVVSYSIRTFSLAIRLFANMMAGHTLLHILSTFSLQLIKLSHFFAIVPVVFILVVYLLEFGIAFIQAYVFTILLCIYSNDSYHPSH